MIQKSAPTHSGFNQPITIRMERRLLNTEICDMLIKTKEANIRNCMV